MKGIEAIIAVILLLLITISVVGFAFVFFSRITATSGAAAENQTQQQIIQFSKQVGIDSYSSTSVAIRNVGTGTIGGGEVAVYITGAPVTCSPALGSIAPSTVQTCTFGGGATCPAGSKVRVSGPANSVDQGC